MKKVIYIVIALALIVGAAGCTTRNPQTTSSRNGARSERLTTGQNGQGGQYGQKGNVGQSNPNDQNGKGRQRDQNSQYDQYDQNGSVPGDNFQDHLYSRKRDRLQDSDCSLNQRRSKGQNQLRTRDRLDQ